ncbi:MAG: 50S ribosomal protein L18 [Bacteroidetes bacterium]|nr:MAG: 50S ribosomal protein L18 [Bacteroidota bacterium]
MKLSKEGRRNRIRRRIRKKVRGTAVRPRLSVYRSNKEIYCQLINDDAGCTLAAASSRDKRVDKSLTKVEQARQVGKILAENAKAKNIVGVVFDRGGYLYHGRVKALADGAREGGLQF